MIDNLEVELTETGLQFAREYDSSIEKKCTIVNINAAGEICVSSEWGTVAYVNLEHIVFNNPEPVTENFVSWHETHFEVAAEIGRRLSDYELYPVLQEINDTRGHGGFYGLASELTDKFEAIHKGREWDGDFFDEIEAFLDKEIGAPEPPALQKAIEQAKNLLDMHGVEYLIGDDLNAYKSQSIKWSVEDFTKNEIDEWQISDEAAEDALCAMIHHHDCNFGITWETVRYFLEEYGEKVPVGTERWRTETL